MSKEPKIKPVVIVGAGGMGRDTQWLIERINEEEPTYEILGYIDDGIQQGSIIDGYPILGGMKYLEEYDKEQKLAVAFAIGNAKVREKLVLKYSPVWSGAREKMHPIQIPDCYNLKFNVVYHEEYTLNDRSIRDHITKSASGTRKYHLYIRYYDNEYRDW